MARFWVVATLLALVFGAGGALLGAFVGDSTSQGFQFDWYRYNGTRTLAAEEAALIAGLAAASIGLVAAVAGVAVACGLFDRGTRKTGLPPERPGARRRDTTTFLHAFLFGAGLPLLVAGLFLGLGSVQGRSFTAREFAVLLAGSTALAGLLAGALPLLLTGAGLRSGRIVRGREDENVFAKTSLAAARNPRATIALLLAITLVAGYGATLITTNVDAADVLPRGDPNTLAAKNLTSKFKSTFTQQVTFQLRIVPESMEDVYEKDNARLPYRQTPVRPQNISDEVYVRAMANLTEFILNYPGAPFTGSVGNHDFYKLINWTIAGGKNASAESFSLPGTTREDEIRFALVNRTVWTLVPSTADAVISPDYAQTALLINVDPKTPMSSREIGDWAIRVRDAYVEKANNDPTYWKVFSGENSPKFSVDLPIANAHSSALAERDFKVLVPAISAFIIVCLFIAFRSVGPIIISFSALAMSLVWTFGAMGFMGIPLNTLNLTVIPLIMGVGIDYGIHMMNEYLVNKSKGKSDEDAFRAAGSHGALALFVATANTVAALLVMVVSPSLLIAQLGILSAIAITTSYLFAIIFIPACLTLTKGKGAKQREYKPSPLMATLARGVSRTRVLVVVVLVLLGTVAYAQNDRLTKEAFGDPPRNWLPEDPLRQEHEKAIAGFYATDNDDVKANVFIFEGDITSPKAHKYMDAVEAALKKQDLVIDDTLRTLPYLVRTYLTVKDGAHGAVDYTAINGLNPRLQGTPLAQNPRFTPYPDSKAEIEALLAEIPSTPLQGIGNLFYDNPNNEMAIMLFSVKAATYEDAERVWVQVHKALDEAAPLKPDNLQVAFFGNTAINYLFVAKELPWVAYMSVVSNILVIALVYIPTRKLKPTLLVATLNFVTSLLWLGLLPSFGIGLAITLTLPLIFIFAIGSDYGLHLALSCEESKDPEETFLTTGKAILFSAITTLGAFLIFTQMSNVAVRRTMIATSLAICVIFFTTMLLVPLFYPVKKRKRAAVTAGNGLAGDHPAAVAEGPTVPVRVRIVYKDAPAEAPDLRAK
ncbi:MAG TPA: MMPL family transporter [Candidatus Thermoplasmatota archaeon]|nr:MMPL family transporter [Candidatus Thermoplasmatota archaeon]